MFTGKIHAELGRLRDEDSILYHPKNDNEIDTLGVFVVIAIRPSGAPFTNMV